jgi:hypothetical protein
MIAKLIRLIALVKSRVRTGRVCLASGRSVDHAGRGQVALSGVDVRPDFVFLKRLLLVLLLVKDVLPNWQSYELFDRGLESRMGL